MTGSRLKQGPWTPPLPGHIHSHTAGRRTHPGGPSDEGTHTLLPTGSPSPGSPPSTSQPPGSTPREGPARPISDLSPPRVGPPAPCLKPRRSQSHSRPQGALWWECWGMSGTLEEHRTGLDPQGQGQGAGTVWGQRPARMNPRDQGGDTLGGAVEGTETCDLAKVNVALVPTVQMEPGREVSPGPSLASSASPLPPGWGHPAIPGSPPCPGASRPPQPPAWPSCKHETLILTPPRGDGGPCPPHSGQRGPVAQS